MAKALEEQRRSPLISDALSFEERVGLLVGSRSRRARHQTSHDPPQVCRCSGARAHAWKTSICARHAASTAASSSDLRRRRLDRPQREPAHHRGNRLAKLDCLRPRPWARPAATIVRSSITASRACSRRSPWLRGDGRYGRLLKTSSAAFNFWDPRRLGPRQF